MKLVYELVEADKGRIVTVSKHTDKTENVIEKDIIPEPDSEKSGRPHLYVTPSTGELFYEYKGKNNMDEIKDRLNEMEKGTGSNGKSGQRGMSQRIDAIEDVQADFEARLQALESK